MMHVEQITLRQLRALDAIAREGSISGAAKVLNLTPPAVHNQLKTLEEIVGYPLVIRGGAEAGNLTARGEVMRLAHDEVFAALQRSIGRMKAMDQGFGGRVVLGVVSTAKYFAPRIVALLREQIPEIDVILKVGNRQETIAGLARNDFDLCIMGRPPRMPLLKAEALADHPHVIIAPPDHPLVHRTNLTSDDILNERIIMREQGSGTRILTARFLSDSHSLNDTAIIEMDSNETIKQAVMSGLGIALLSAHTVSDEVRAGRISVLRVKGTPIVRKWYLIRKEGTSDANNATQRIQTWIGANTSAYLPTDLPFADTP